MFQRWGFLLGEIWVLLALAALLGLFVGWLIWSRREDTSFNSREADSLRASLDACNAKGRDQAARIAALEGDLASANAATRAAESDAAAARAASEAGLATDRTSVFRSDASTATAAAAVAAPLVSFGAGTADASADTEFGQEDTAESSAAAEMPHDTNVGDADMRANVGGDHDVDGELLAEDDLHADGDANDTVEDLVTSSTGAMDEMLADVMPQGTSDVDANASAIADADADFVDEQDADDNDDLDDETFAASSTGSVDGVAAGLMSSVDASSDNTTADTTDAAAKAKAANRAKKKAKAEAAAQAAKAQTEKAAAAANGEAHDMGATGTDAMGGEVKAAVRPQGLDMARDGNPDDLKMIKGIGPKLEILCNTLGFFHFDQIAAWTAKEIAWVDDNLEGFKSRVTRDEWVKQAAILAKGGTTEFANRVKDGDVY